MNDSGAAETGKLKISKYVQLWRTVKKRIVDSPNAAARFLKPSLSIETVSEGSTANTDEILIRLRDYLSLPDEPNARFNPKWLAAKLETGERAMLDALAYALRDGLVELHWEVYCPACGASPAEYDSLKNAESAIHCPACGSDFDLHLDRDVRVTFSATENLRRSRGGESVSLAPDAGNFSATRGLDLLLSPAFRKFFSGETPSENESLRIGRVAILFTDLRGSTAIYAERGDPQAYKMVREHFDILTRAVERNRGTLVKTIGDSMMASFTTSADGVLAALEAQAELRTRIAQIGGELILKAGVHTGTCLAVNLNDRLDFFGGAVNIAARVQGISHGNDVVATGEAFAEVESAALKVRVIESFDSKLRGLPHAVRVYRLVS